MLHDNDRALLVQKAAEAGERQGCKDEHLGRYLARYYRHVSLDDLRDRDAVDLAGAALSHRQLAAKRPQGTAIVRVFTPTVEEHGWSHRAHRGRGGHRRHAVPGRLGQRRAGPHRPRDPRRGAPAVRGPAGRHRRRCSRCSTPAPRRPTARPGRGTPTPSLDAHRDRPRDRPAPRSSSSRERLRRVLDDVRVAVEDWPKMRSAPADRRRARRRAARRRRPRRSPRRSSCCAGWPTTISPSSATASTSWSPRRRAGRCCGAVPGTGLGILRDDQPAASGASTGSARGRAKAREHTPAGADQGQLAVDRAPAGLPGLRRGEDVRRDGRGDRRAALPRPVHLGRLHRERARHPGGPAQGRGGAGAGRVLARTATPARTCCRSWRPTRATSCSRSAIDDLYARSPSPCCTCRSAGGLRLFLRRDDYGRYISCLVYLPAGPLHHRGPAAMEDDPARGLRRRRASTTPLGSPSRCWPGCTSSSGCRRARCREVDAGATLEAGWSRPPATWDDDFADALRSDAGEEEAARLAARWRPRLPGGVQGGLPGPGRGGRPPPAGGADATPARLGMKLYEPDGAGAGRAAVQALPPASRSRCPRCCPSCNLGVEVVDERPYEMRAPTAHGLDLRLRAAADRRRPASCRDDRRTSCSQDAFAAAWCGDGRERRLQRAGAAARG